MRSLRRPRAQWASQRSRLALVLSASVLASVFAFGATAASPTPAAALTATWNDVELYYLDLLNCTRTGGWVRKDGTCKAYGSGTYSAYRKPLKLSAGISDVARRWARKIATEGACRHGDPGRRLRKAGYTGYAWGENIGCYDLANAYKSVLASHRAFQKEKKTGGGHWKNIKNKRYREVGIGVWKANGHTRLVVDFYRA
jgi:hypothetical protein